MVLLGWRLPWILFGWCLLSCYMAGLHARCRSDCLLRLLAPIACSDCLLRLLAPIACSDCVLRLLAPIACSDCLLAADLPLADLLLAPLQITPRHLPEEANSHLPVSYLGSLPQYTITSPRGNLSPETRHVGSGGGNWGGGAHGCRDVSPEGAKVFAGRWLRNSTGSRTKHNMALEQRLAADSSAPDVNHMFLSLPVLVCV